MELLLGSSKVILTNLYENRSIIFQLNNALLDNMSSALPLFNTITIPSNSVSWQVQELVLEYASLIEAHFGKLLSYVQRNNWRTNPNILIGARVAVFRKSATLLPGIATG